MILIYRIELNNCDFSLKMSAHFGISRVMFLGSHDLDNLRESMYVVCAEVLLKMIPPFREWFG